MHDEDAKWGCGAPRMWNFDFWCILENVPIKKLKWIIESLKNTEEWVILRSVFENAKESLNCFHPSHQFIVSRQIELLSTDSKTQECKWKMHWMQTASSVKSMRRSTTLIVDCNLHPPNSFLSTLIITYSKMLNSVSERYGECLTHLRNYSWQNEAMNLQNEMLLERVRLWLRVNQNLFVIKDDKLVTFITAKD